MDDTRFWSVVASMGPELAVSRLAMVLSALTPTDLRAFCQWLNEVEGELDTPAHHVGGDTAFEIGRDRRVRRTWSVPDTQRPAHFEDLQATVVAHGRDAWQAVVSGPTLLSGGWPTGLGRQLALAVSDAWHRAFPDPIAA